MVCEHRGVQDERSVKHMTEFVKACEEHALYMDSETDLSASEFFPGEKDQFPKWTLTQGDYKTVVIDHGGTVSWYFFERGILQTALIGTYEALRNDSMMEVYAV